MKRAQGFTLLEMSVVLLVLGVMTAGGLAIFAASLSNQQLKETQAKIAAIQSALYNYRIAFNRIPCPADVTLPIGDAYFGMEGVAAGDCATGSTYVSGARTAAASPGPTANFIQSPAVGAQDARQGMVPIRTLRLPQDYGFDGWGRRIMYAVAKDMTQANAFPLLIPANDATIRMKVEETTAAPATVISPIAAYVLISFGPNGHGGYPRNGGVARVSSGSANADELENCHCTTSATATALDGIFVQKLMMEDALTLNHSNDFDDIVVYQTRSDLRSPAE